LAHERLDLLVRQFHRIVRQSNGSERAAVLLWRAAAFPVIAEKIDFRIGDFPKKASLALGKIRFFGWLVICAKSESPSAVTVRMSL
jgi:hypothetical protein